MRQDNLYKLTMRKIIIIGCPGAGKSTFARKLNQKLSFPLYYLDMIWHKPDKTTCSREEFDGRLREILEKDTWIIDGNYLRTLEMRLKEADTVFLLDYPLEVCLAGAMERIGKKREDLPFVETEPDEEFRQWILDFPGDQLPVIYRLLKQYESGREIFVFRSREEADRFCDRMWKNTF